MKEGHICLDLNDLAGKIIFRNDEGKEIIECPRLDLWLALLRKSSCVGDPGYFKPLILDAKNRLYLHRYWQYEKAWAMTVHKSQGLEFEMVLLVLSDRDVRLITRELVYTGITRTRGGVDIWAGEDLLMKAIARVISRKSGLADTLRNLTVL